MMMPHDIQQNPRVALFFTIVLSLGFLSLFMIALGVLLAAIYVVALALSTLCELIHTIFTLYAGADSFTKFLIMLVALCVIWKVAPIAGRVLALRLERRA